MKWLALVALVMLPLAGCVADEPAELPPDPGTRPADGETPDPPQEEVVSEEAPGIVLVGDADPCDGWCVNVTATNEGSETYYVSNICTSPWSESMSRGGEDVQHREPMFTCLAFGLAPFETNDMLYFEADWNETIWTEDGYEDAPPGTYTWTITLTVYEDMEGGDSHQIPISFDLVVENDSPR